MAVSLHIAAQSFQPPEVQDGLEFTSIHAGLQSGNNSGSSKEVASVKCVVGDS